MIKLTRPEFIQLRDVLADRFNNKILLDELAANLSRQNMDNIAIANGVVEILNIVISKAQVEGWLIDLITTAQRLGANNGILQQFLDKFQLVEELGESDPCKVHVLRDGSPFVDRQQLRTSVSKLDMGNNILVVDGERGSGKSYSLRLIRYVRDENDTFTIVFVDLFKLAKETSGAIRPEQIGETIARQMNLVQMRERQNEQDSAWVQAFCDWLTGQLARNTIVRWIVIDNYDKVLLSSGAQDLIKELAIRVTANLSNVRLVLLGYPDIMELKGIIHEEPQYERIAPIGKQELSRFFGNLYDARKRLRNLDFTDNDVINSVARVLSQVNPEKSDLVALSEAIKLELHTII